MRKILLVMVGLWLLTTPVLAQETATSSATGSAEVVTEQKIPEIKTDLTQPTVEVKNKLEAVLFENPVGELSWKNFLRHALDSAVENGVPANTAVLILLFPLVVAIVAAARHLIGIRGAGILTPSLLAVSFLATGIWAGVALFGVILLVSTLARTLLKQMRLQYLPRLALLLWMVSGAVFLSLWGASFWEFTRGIMEVGIFPILILMLLAETFIDIQSGRSGSEARAMILQTFVLAMFASLILGWEVVQKTVLLYPELIYFGVGVFDIFMGKYTGLRLSEYWLFKKATNDDEEE
ncbi:MAG: hypothetical protein UX38_C0003G0037 [Microgenomates group bacterium GW2011_GWC1_46_16]|uniref:7 transmembrane helices usually fused to an inactive transglutaminase domain-containing protein n=2 Tax=Candidatus Collieribacteriota TaxID=1752725 RepID=A0A1F5G0H9_9BACT|nr:MAG: hypothetical protein UX38_C0003G0037 [Microgenomates group bacterium GW2011_GWC1_46_16]KKU44241.1 MAG: hypothetical protein UX59_C0002G0027 [Microgenomates group bacterium GW2011_GWA1_46_7]OGD70285.1 MAG: hypothetical protein A2187_02430 [Candidatus Collierbacteria bacterium RIFOXYA1_FULL_46_24]OGD74245.1 MAG: hypothetical protein A2228_03775 [Candidatus Collierbacteria bacterium RIFOXYA2_FULL_46_10]OGD85383.1 MAG: hypothetical protein A2618_00270 [Candidatus Collierbacteria bacterium R